MVRTYQYAYLLQQLPHLDPAHVIPPGEAPYALPHRPFVDTRIAEVGRADFETLVEVGREVHEVDDEEAGFDPNDPEHFPYPESQPVPQYADVLPHHPYLL